MKKFGNLMLEFILVIIGNTLCAFGVVCFVIPGELITGGSTGVGLFLNHITGISVSLAVFLLNIMLFLVGMFFLGKKFAVTTMLSTFYYPLTIEIFKQSMGSYVITTDPVLCTVFGGLCMGAAVGLVFRAGSSTGGMDIPPLVLHKMFGWPVSVLVYLFDFLILFLQCAACSGEALLYGILLVLITAIVIDKCMLIGTGQIELKIISQHTEIIRQRILAEADRGVTLLKAESGYLQQEMDLLLTVVSKRELRKVERMVHETDEEAFVIISSVREVRGEGFTLEKK